MIICGIKNSKLSFEEAAEKQFQIISIMAKHGIITHYRNKKESLGIDKFTIEQLKVNLAKQVKEFLSDKKDLNSSSIGYDLFVPIKCFNKTAAITIRFGTPEISGTDVIVLNEPSLMLSQNYNEVITKFYEMLLELIPIINPYDVVCKDYVLEDEMNDENSVYGFIMYQSGDNLLKLAKNNKIKLTELNDGFIWKADFSSYENGVKSVKDWL